MASINKQSGIKHSEYVANNVGYNYKSINSFYDNSTEIEIDINGILYKGIIRISDHEIALNNWALNNPKYDFGISFVIEENQSYWNGSNIVNVSDRSITIYEYTYLTSRQNFDFLNRLIYKIINIKHSGKYLANHVIIGKLFKVISNSSLYEKIMNNIKKFFK